MRVLHSVDILEDYLDRQVDHDVVEILPGEEVVVHLVFLSPVQFGERFCTTEYLFQNYNYVRKEILLM